MQSQNKTVELRIPHDTGLKLRKSLLESGKENVALGRIGGASISDGYAILLNSIVSVPLDSYRKGHHGVSWPASFNAQAIEEASKLRLGLLVLHAHPWQDSPDLSDIDKQNGKLLCAAFKTAIPKLPHGTAVLGANGSAGGLAWLPGQSEPLAITRVRWISDPLVIVPSRKTGQYYPRQMYSTQKILIGEEGQRLLAASHIGIVGLGGGGSHVVQQLALLGVGHLTLVDGDRIDETNRHRMVGARPSDVTQGLKKVDVMKRLILESNPNVEVTIVLDKFPSDQTIQALKECDSIVGCVDTLHSRKELQDFAWRHLIPYVDIGLSIQLDNDMKSKTRALWRISGQVYDLIPGAACLWCAQFITTDRLSEEAGGRDPSYMQSPQRAQVVSLNGVLASQAVNEVLHLLTGYASRERVPNALQYDGIKGTLSPVILERKADCKVCSYELGRGDPMW